MKSENTINLPFCIRSYILEKEIAKGGFGSVYLATSTKFPDYQFAVKIIKITDSTMKEDCISLKKLESFESEVQALKKLDHPHVIRLYDYFREGHIMFLVLEYCSGGTLEQRINKLNLTEKIKICHDVVLGLKYCHDNQVAHRDIKTSNVMFTANDQVKIVDFGLAEFLEEDQKISKVGGSLYYLPPEIINKTSHSPFKADIWSLGVLMYRVFVQKYPFEGYNKDVVFKAIKNCLYVPNRLPREIIPIVTKMLTPDPDERLTLLQVQIFFEKMVMKAMQLRLPIKNLPGIRSSRSPTMVTPFRKNLMKNKINPSGSSFKIKQNDQSHPIKSLNVKCLGPVYTFQRI